ncbi:MAG: DUF262 domain-containing protein [Nitrososphaerota archaeon]|nr:DUF262 domain-containing protein [Nitrososphaerota archaeon]
MSDTYNEFTCPRRRESPIATTLEAIKADAKTVREVLDKNKYELDVFQREYKWERKQIEQLLADLETKFFSNYQKAHERKDVQKYSKYFLGPIIISLKEGNRTIIDGQQRLTSITLLLIYLNNMQEAKSEKVPINDLIFSEKYGEKSFNIQIPERRECIEALFNDQSDGYDSSKAGESVKNILARYQDIIELFPEELKNDALPFFIDWLIDNITFVEIKTYTDEDGYTIFETMNDRGLNLTPTEMLKGYLLSNVGPPDQKLELNDLWKARVFELDERIGEDEDQEFFRAWLRAKYAQTIRPGKAGAENEDFEKIATRFHQWVRDNKENLGLKTSTDFYNFIRKNFDFFSTLYLEIHKAAMAFDKQLEYVYYLEKGRFARSFYFPLLLSTVEMADDRDDVRKKFALVSRFLETFMVFRSVNFRTLSYSSIRYTMFNMIKEIRGKSVDELRDILKEKVNGLDNKLENFGDLRLHGMNKRFIHFLLARLTRHIEEKCGVASNFADYVNPDLARPFEIEHVWSDRYALHKDEFDDSADFEEYRNKIGALLLIQKGPNQSYNDDDYESKLPLYFGQNLLAKSLSEKCYEKNPDFLRYVRESGLHFKPRDHFRKNDILERQKLYQEICEEIWSLKGFDNIAEGRT